MTRFPRAIIICTVVFATLIVQRAMAQSVIDPADPVVNYDPNHPPANPGWMQMTKWVRTPNTNVQNRNNGWTADNYKCYNWQGLAFRVRFPKNYSTANDGKKYPLIVFLHGKGEVATLTNGQNYDNEFQLLQGPYEFEQAILNDKWNGFVIAPQVTDLFYDGDFDRIMQIVDYMIANNKVDPFGVVADGLSSGGLATFQLFNKYPLYFSSITPISPPVQLDLNYWPYNQSYISNKRFTPIWISQGGIDTNPAPATTQQLQDSMLKYGANFKRTVYPGTGHGTWYNFWSEPDFWPFINRSYMSNPWMLGGLKNRWPGEPFIDTIGVMPGFDGYQWRYNGATVLPNQTSNTLVVTAPGIYESRVLKGSLWSDWSHIPINIRTGFYEAENFSSMSGVQTEPTTDVNGGLDVGFIDNGDWMNYTLNVYAAGIFRLDLRVAAMFAGGVIKVLKSDGVTVLATVNVPPTGGFQTWTTVSTTVSLPAGTQTIRLQSAANAAWNINWLQFSIPSNGSLPVKFVYFNAQCKGSGVSLEWKTAQEQNTNDFSVQRSTDGSSWTSIATLPAAGQSSVERSYVFEDRNTATSSMYRIVEKDYSGQTTISSIVRSNCSSTSRVALYPNPTKGNSSLSISLAKPSKVVLRILDSKGAQMLQNQIQLPSGSNILPLDVSEYAQGVYTIQVQYDGNVKTLKMIKK